MAEIEELDDTAQRLRVLWRKTNNFYASFASILFDTKKQFEAGAYPGWEFDSWLFQKAGLPEAYVMQQLKVFSRVINAEARDKVEQAVIRQAVEKRKAKQAREAEKQAEMTEKRAVAALKKEENEKIRQEKAAEKAARGQQKSIDKPSPQPPAGDAKIDDRRRRDALRNKVLRAARKQAAAQAGPDNPVLRDGLTECRKIEASNRVQLGAVYIRLKEEVDMRRAGKNPNNGKFWTWGEWSSFYITGRKPASIRQCIADYTDDLLKRQGLAIQQTENVVSFPQAVG